MQMNSVKAPSNYKMTNKINPGELWGEHQDFCYNNNFQYCLFVISTQTDHDGKEHILHLCVNLETGAVEYVTFNHKMFVNGASKLL